MKLLLHICCAPCCLYPVKQFKNEGIDFDGFWYNPNIHPFLEYSKRRLETIHLSEILGFKLAQYDTYNLEMWLQIALSDFKNRCEYCYRSRLETTAKFALANGYDAFTTTLLYSKYQNHTLIKSICEEISTKLCIAFYYQDFRIGWNQGIELSRKYNIYRQQYCGCVFSEYDRFKDDAEKYLAKHEWNYAKKDKIS